MSDAELETIIASAITRAVAQEREQCAFMPNAEPFVIKKRSDLELGKAAAYIDMAFKIRHRSQMDGR